MASSSSSSGIGFFGLLSVLFIGLKLTGFITWSWFWVLFPVTFPLSIVAIIGIGAVVILAVDKWNKY